MPRIPTRTLLSLGAALFLLSACGDGPTAEERLAKATELREQGDLSAATLELKNALRDDGNLGEARFMLGEIYNDLGDGVSAEKELETARTLGVRDARLEVPLARAWVLQGNYQKVLDEVPLDSNATSERKIAVLIARAQSYYGLGQTVQAEKAYDAALSESPDNVDALVGLVRVAMSRDDSDQADADLARAVAAAPDDFQVLAVKGDLQLFKKDYEAAHQTFTEALTQSPDNIGAHIGQAQALIGLQQYEKASPLLDKVIKQLKTHHQPYYLRSIVAYQTKDFGEAKKYAEEAIKIAPNYIPAYLVAGAANFAVGQLEQANQYLTRYVSVNPTPEAERLLGTVQLQLGRPADALRSLAPLADSAPDEHLLTMVGLAAVQNGDLRSGTRYFRKVLEGDPSDTKSRARLGLLQIALGDRKAGINELEKAVAESPDLQEPEISLILNYLQDRDFEKALAAAKRYQGRHPNNATGYSLEGMAMLGLQKAQEAHVAFEKALELKPGDPDASHNLAVMALADKDYTTARSLYRDVLQHNPKNAVTYQRLSALEKAAGDMEAARNWLKSAIDRGAADALARLDLGRMLVQSGDFAGAVRTAQTALSSSPPSSVRSALLEVVGRSQMAMGQVRDAQSTFSTLAGLNPDSIAAQFGLAGAAYTASDFATARRALDAVLEMDLDHKGALVARARIAIDDDDLEKAKQLVERLGKEAANEDVVTEFNGIIALREKRNDDAVAAFKHLVELRGNSTDILRLIDLEWQLDLHDQALADIEAWLKEHPKDQTVRFKKGQLLMELQDWPGVISAYEKVIEVVPDSIPSRNNLAWALLQTGKIDDALKHAERAYELGPTQPIVLDTFGMVQLARGETDSAVDLIKRASGYAPKDLSIRFHLGKAYAAQGQKARAIEILRALVGNGAEFPERGEAEALLAELSKSETKD